MPQAEGNRPGSPIPVVSGHTVAVTCLHSGCTGKPWFWRFETSIVSVGKIRMMTGPMPTPGQHSRHRQELQRTDSGRDGDITCLAPSCLLLVAFGEQSKPAISAAHRRGAADVALPPRSCETRFPPHACEKTMDQATPANGAKMARQCPPTRFRQSPHLGIWILIVSSRASLSSPAALDIAGCRRADDDGVAWRRAW